MHRGKQRCSVFPLTAVGLIRRSAAMVAIACSAGALIVGCGGSSNQTSTAEDQARNHFREVDRRQAGALHRLERRLAVEQARAGQRRAREIRRRPEAEEPELPPESPPSGHSALAGFDSLAESLPGEVGVAMGPPGQPPAVVAGDLTTGSAWSTSKVPVAMAVLREAGGPSGLSSTESEEMRRALTESDNEAALALFAYLESLHGGPEGAAAAVDEILREAGDQTTQVSSVGRDGFTPFGQTEWSVALQEQFMSHLAAGCIGDHDSTDYVLGLMGEVTSDSWGLGSAGLPARWKGGWGPGTDGRYLARQMGILQVAQGETVVVVAARADDGTYESAAEIDTTLAQWLAGRAPTYAGPTAGC